MHPDGKNGGVIVLINQISLFGLALVQVVRMGFLAVCFQIGYFTSLRVNFLSFKVVMIVVPSAWGSFQE